MADEWTDQELDAAVEAYLAMLARENAGEQYSKAEYRRQYLAGPLRDRTEGSFEFRMQNISHVLENDLQAERIEGYRPAKNVGDATAARIREALLRRLGDVSAAPATFDPVELEKETKSARSRIRKSKGALKPRGNARPRSRSGQTTVYERDPNVRGWVLENAKGVCECCRKPGPFLNAAGEPYLEVHHVIQLAKGGPDIVENAVAICPNCHRESHLGPTPTEWITKIRLNVARLQS